MTQKRKRKEKIKKRYGKIIALIVIFPVVGVVWQLLPGPGAVMGENLECREVTNQESGVAEEGKTQKSDGAECGEIQKADNVEGLKKQETGKLWGKEDALTGTETGNELQNIRSILQNPELPTGCEATVGTMLLNAYGYSVDKTEVADVIKRGVMEEKNGKYYAPHPDDAFIGNPYTYGGYGVFPRPLAEAMQKIIDRQHGVHTAQPLYGLNEQEILNLVKQGIPVCIWSSIGGLEIEDQGGWYLTEGGKETGEYFVWPANEHVVVLIGYDDQYVSVLDPLKGPYTYERSSFFRHYAQVGKYALILK